MKREKIVPVRVNVKENEILQEKAAKLGLTLATFIRMAALNYKMEEVK